MVSYDPSVIQDQAEKLYKQASFLQIERALLWAAIGFALTYFAASALWSTISGVSPSAGGLVGGVLLGWVGFRSASETAFRLRLQAQTALCQVQIERNTSQGGQSAP